jgi:hypothetical protein
MATQTYYFRGECKWAMVHSMDTKYGNYKINLYLDEASKKLYATSGLQMGSKKEQEGIDEETGKQKRPIACALDDPESFITFRRAGSKTIKGETVNFGKPKVLNVDNEVTNDLIGNGSEVTIKVLAFDTMNGIGHRLDAVKIDNLVPYEGKETEKHVPDGWGDGVDGEVNW